MLGADEVRSGRSNSSFRLGIRERDDLGVASGFAFGFLFLFFPVVSAGGLVKTGSLGGGIVGSGSGTCVLLLNSPVRETKHIWLIC
jgi:hypothetical protein